MPVRHISLEFLKSVVTFFSNNEDIRMMMVMVFGTTCVLFTTTV